jgi:hypothetical protein
MKKTEHELLVRRLQRMDDGEYWDAFARYYGESPREFLVTLLRGMGERDPLRSDVFLSLLPSFSEIDRQKTAERLIDSYDEPSSLLSLLHHLGYDEPASLIPLLIKHQGMPSAFLLLRALRYVEEDRELLMRVARFLLRRDDAVAFNLASVMRLSFNLESLRGTFSLRLEPWQLDKMENDWNFFSQQMKM